LPLGFILSCACFAPGQWAAAASFLG